MITNAAAYRNDPNKVATFRQAFAEKAMEVGYALEATADEPTEAPLSLAGTAVSFDGVAFRLKEDCEAEDVDIVMLFARVVGWPSLVVEGDAKLADLIAVAGASIDMFMVNRSPSAAARHIISQTNFERFKTGIARADRLGIVAKSLADVAPGSAAAPPARIARTLSRHRPPKLMLSRQAPQSLQRRSWSSRAPRCRLSRLLRLAPT